MLIFALKHKFHLMTCMVSVLIILFLLFYIQLFSYFFCKYVNKRSVFSRPTQYTGRDFLYWTAWKTISVHHWESVSCRRWHFCR